MIDLFKALSMDVKAELEGRWFSLPEISENTNKPVRLKLCSLRRVSPAIGDRIRQDINMLNKELKKNSALAEHFKLVKTSLASIQGAKAGLLTDGAAWLVSIIGYSGTETYGEKGLDFIYNYRCKLYAKYVVTGWNNQVMKKGKVVADVYTPEKGEKLLKASPLLMSAIYNKAEDWRNFRTEQADEKLKEGELE